MMKCPYCSCTVILDGPAERVTRANTDVQVARVAPVGAMVVLAICVVALPIIIGGVVFAVVHSARRTVAATALNVPPAISLPKFPSLAQPPASAFAKMVQEFGSPGIGPGQFKDSRSIAVDASGRIYVGEYSGGRIQVFDAGGQFLKAWSIGDKQSLMNLAAKRDGTLLAITGGRILCFEGKSGTPLGEAARTTDDGQEYYRDATIALDGDIYALDLNMNVVVLNGDGQIRKKFMNAREKVGESLNFDKLAINGNGELYLLERTKGIFKFAPDGRYINRFGPDEESHQMLFNLAVDGQGRVCASGTGAAVSVYSGSGKLLDSFGGHEVCFGLSIDDKNNVYGCFRNRQVVRKYEPIAHP
jgi:hypothetical protein